MKFDIEKFNDTPGAIWNMDDPVKDLLLIPADGKQALVAIRNGETKEWTWIRKDFRLE